MIIDGDRVNRLESGAIPRLLLAVSLTACAASYMWHTPGIGYDGAQYLKYATNLVATGSFTFDGVTLSCGRAPGYPAFLAIMLTMWGSIDLVYPIQFACLFGTYWFTGTAYRDVLPAVGRGQLVLLLVLIVPIHRLAADLVGETTFFLLTAAALAALARGLQRDQVGLFVIAGGLLGLSSYIRPVNLLAAVFIAGTVIVFHRRSWRRAVVLAITSMVVVLPWTIRNAVQFERLVPMASHFGSFYYMTDAEAFWPILTRSAGHSHQMAIHRDIVGDDLELDVDANQRYLERGLKNIKDDPLGFVGRCIVKTVFVWSYMPGTKGLLLTAPLLFGLGVLCQWLFLFLSFRGWIALRPRAPALAFTIMTYAIYTVAILFPFYAESRFLLPVYIWLVGLVWYWAYANRASLISYLPIHLRRHLNWDG